MKNLKLCIIIFLFYLTPAFPQISIDYISGENLNCIKFITPETGFICGNNGTLLVTNDSGKTWQSRNSFTKKTLNSISFSNDSMGFIVGQEIISIGLSRPIYTGIILATSDKGKNWKVIHESANEIFYLVYFINDLVGFYSGTRYDTASFYVSFISKTTDGGITWNNNNLVGIFAGVKSIKFSDSITGYAVGTYLSLKTTDAGDTWIKQNPDFYYWPGLYDLYCFDNNNVIQFGEAIIKTEDGGETWSFVSKEGAFLGFRSVKYINNSEAIAVGGSGLFGKSTDGGTNWQNINLYNDKTLSSVDIPQRNKGFAVGESGILVKFNFDSLQNISSIDGRKVNIYTYSLSQNYPNPFNPTTKIRYSIPQTTFVTLKIYNLLGREVTTLVNEEKTAGNYEVEFSATGGASQLSSGVYFYKLEAGSYTAAKKFLLLK